MWWELRMSRRKLADEVTNLKPEYLFDGINCAFQKTTIVSFHILCS
jgi:hypothetical protein